MSDMQQGEEYEEEAYDPEDGEEAEYEDEEAELEIDTFFGIPKQTVYIGGAILLVIAIAVGVLLTWRKKEEPEVPEYTDNDFLDDAPEVDIDLEDIYEDNYEYESEYVEDYDTPDSVTDITTEEAEELRRYGYTGDEIELALQYGMDTQAMIDHGIELRDQEAKDALVRMSDTAGPEYKRLLNYTYLGEPEVLNPSGDRSQYEETKATVKINADYVKCPTNGPQLWLKCHIATDAYIWYQCSPVRWLSLPDEGNIVLNVDFYMMNDTAYVVHVEEADSSLDSIDASAHNMDGVLSEENEGNTEQPAEAETSESEEPTEGAAFLTE